MPEWLFTALFFVVTMSLIFVGAHTLDRFVWAPKRQREMEARPRITAEELAAYWQSLDDASLPMARVVTSADELKRAVQSRIGGAPFAARPDVLWPTSRYGDKMIFIGQVNFSDMPKLDDFPETGLLQIFTSLEASDETGMLSEVDIRFIESPEGDDVMAIPDEILTSKSVRRDFSKHVIELGLPMEFRTHKAMGNPCNHPFADQSSSFFERLPENDVVGHELNNLEDREVAIVENYGSHWIGGQPSFTQFDIRHDAKFAHLDRVIFHLGADDGINIGDSGEVNVLINAKDLREKNFEKAVLTWDCC